MKGALPIQILLITMLGTTGLNFFFVRVYAIGSALSVRLYCRKEQEMPARDVKGTAAFHDALLAEIKRAGNNILYAFYTALMLMLFLWLFGRQEMHEEYLSITTLLMKFARIVCVFSELSRIAVALILPTGLACRDRAIPAVKSYLPSLLCVMLLYGVVLWLYSL